MTSDIQKIARALTDLGKETGGLAAGVRAAATQCRDLGSRAEQAGAGGVPVHALLAQLQVATTRTKAAAAAVEQVRRHGEQFADHLVQTRGSGTSFGSRAGKVVKETLEGVAIAGVLGGGIVNFGTAVTQMPTTGAKDNGPTPAQVLDDYIQAHNENIDSMNDLRESLDTEVADQIREPESGDRRPPPPAGHDR